MQAGWKGKNHLETWGSKTKHFRGVSNKIIVDLRVDLSNYKQKYYIEKKNIKKK
jgi:hypothetical protein